MQRHCRDLSPCPTPQEGMEWEGRGWHYFEVEPAEPPFLNHHIFRHLCKTWLEKLFLDWIMSTIVASWGWSAPENGSGTVNCVKATVAQVTSKLWLQLESLNMFRNPALLVGFSAVGHNFWSATSLAEVVQFNTEAWPSLWPNSQKNWQEKFGCVSFS